MPTGEGEGVKVITRPVSTCEVDFCNNADKEGIVYLAQSINLYHIIKTNTEKPSSTPRLIIIEKLVLKPNECTRARVGSIVIRAWHDKGELRIIECGIVHPGFCNIKRLECPSDEEVWGVIRMMNGGGSGVVTPYITAVAIALLKRLDSGLALS
jgi:hypothetical protein